MPNVPRRSACEIHRETWGRTRHRPVYIAPLRTVRHPCTHSDIPSGMWSQTSPREGRGLRGAPQRALRRSASPWCCTSSFACAATTSAAHPHPAAFPQPPSRMTIIRVIRIRTTTWTAQVLQRFRKTRCTGRPSLCCSACPQDGSFCLRPPSGVPPASGAGPRHARPVTWQAFAC
jgi:hypothetical protein